MSDVLPVRFSERIVDWDKFFLPYKQAVSELTVKLRALAEGYAMIAEKPPIEEVTGRVKSVTSVLSKAKRKGVPLDEVETRIEDIAGIRVMCRFVDDIAEIAQMIRDRHGLDMEILEERDYVTKAKESGYRSYHIIVNYPVITALGKKDVRCEIQIRTLAMNFWAVVEHSLKYKYSGMLPPELQRRLLWSADAAARLDNEISEIRDDVLEAENHELERGKTIDGIVGKIRALSFVAEPEAVESLTRAFYGLYENGTADELMDLDKTITQISDGYRTISV